MQTVMQSIRNDAKNVNFCKILEKIKNVENVSSRFPESSAAQKMMQNAVFDVKNDAFSKFLTVMKNCMPYDLMM